MSSLHNLDLDPTCLPAFRCAECNSIAQSIMVGAERQWIGWCPDHGWTAVQRTEALTGRDNNAGAVESRPSLSPVARPASASEEKEAKDVTA